MPSVFIFGEVMLELTQPRPAEDPEEARLGFGGDTFNTAVYLARLGQTATYVTALGRDPYSDQLMSLMSQEGVCTNHVLIHPDRLPGLYAIRTDAHGERSFSYWRSQSAVRDILSLPDAEKTLSAISKADWLYLSGISLSLFDANGRARLRDVAERVRARGGDVIFDPNYRPKGWPDRETAQQAIADFAPTVTIALPTAEDEDALFGSASPTDHAKRWIASGARTVVEKVGPDGAVLFGEAHDPVTVPTQSIPHPLDTTGAGDSFNAGFLSALMSGADMETAVRAGHTLAGAVILQRGAIIPLKSMPT